MPSAALIAQAIDQAYVDRVSRIFEQACRDAAKGNITSATPLMAREMAIADDVHDAMLAQRRGR